MSFDKESLFSPAVLEGEGCRVILRLAGIPDYAVGSDGGVSTLNRTLHKQATSPAMQHAVVAYDTEAVYVDATFLDGQDKFGLLAQVVADTDNALMLNAHPFELNAARLSSALPSMATRSAWEEMSGQSSADVTSHAQELIAKHRDNAAEADLQRILSYHAFSA